MTQDDTTEAIWVTQEAYDRLQEELDHLRGEVRSSITAKIAQARDEGDLSENGGYHAAREEQGKNEARIRQLEDRLRRAQIGERPADDGLVEAGMRVTIRFEGDADTETFLLGSRELLTLDSAVDLDVYSPTSPLGEAIAGKSVGDTASYQTPTGATITVEIVDAVPF
ncbi:MAG TPA: transcription elongation factor GreA [Aeromicrobium sp.]|nr:transcription elongation factor GreA [Aeromicrobium sp.]